MLFNHIKTAVRSLFRYKNYSVFNIAGLAAGIAVCLLIAIIIRFETSFDGFHKNKDQLYRVLIEYHHPGDNGIFYGAATPFPLPGVIKKDFPELKKHILDQQGDIRSFVNIFAGDDDIRDLQKEKTPVSHSTVISIVPAIAGGSF